MNVLGHCTCGHEESDGRMDVLNCAVHGFEARTDQARRITGEAFEVERLREQLRGAVDLVREMGSAWRANDDEAISNALARLENAVGLREQGTPPAGGQ